VRTGITSIDDTNINCVGERIEEHKRLTYRLCILTAHGVLRACSARLHSTPVGKSSTANLLFGFV
jgi:hypothetical protein